MALIKCPECGTRVSNYAPICPSCGYPIQSLMDDSADQSTQSDPTHINQTVTALQNPEIYVPKNEIDKLVRTLYWVVCVIFIVIVFSAWNSASSGTQTVLSISVMASLMLGALLNLIIDTRNNKIRKLNIDEVKRVALENHTNWLKQNQLHPDKQLMPAPLIVETCVNKNLLIIGESILPFSKVLGSELETKSKSTQKGNIASNAVVGGLVAGSVGAMIGMASAMYKNLSKADIIGITVHISDVSHPSTLINGNPEDCLRIHDTIRAIVAGRVRQ